MDQPLDELRVPLAPQAADAAIVPIEAPGAPGAPAAPQALGAPAAPAVPEVPVVPQFKWYAVDVTRAGIGPINMRLPPEQVQILERQLSTTPRFGRTNPFGRPPRDPQPGVRAPDELQPGFQVLTTRLRDMWRPAEAAGLAEADADKYVLVLQERDPYPAGHQHAGRRPWRLLVPIIEGWALDLQLQDNANWVASELYANSAACCAQECLRIKNQDLPVLFECEGRQDGVIVQYTTLYERFPAPGQGQERRGTSERSCVPVKIFDHSNLYETAAQEGAPQGRKLREEFNFTHDGQVLSQAGVFTWSQEGDTVFYARIFTKGWWVKQLSFYVFLCGFAFIDWYNNLTFAVNLFSQPGKLAFFFSLSSLFSLLLFGYCAFVVTSHELRITEDNQTTLEDLGIYERDNSLDRKLLFAALTLCHFLMIPSFFKEILIWVHPRGVAMGKAAMKLNGVRATLGTWPSKKHFLCDTQVGHHQLLPANILTNCILAAIMIWDIHYGKNPQHIVLLPPKIFRILYGLAQFLVLTWQRRALREWALEAIRRRTGNVEDPGRIADDPDWRLDPLKRNIHDNVLKKHFANAPNDTFGEYRSHHLSSLLPEDAHVFAGILSVVVVVLFAIAWVA